ncbi:MAG: Rrf2 family transcriptional regulator [Patescibacteria group bacterium]
MIKLKKETDYAVVLVQYLIRNKDRRISLREFSNVSGISFWFLQKIARKLNSAGIIKAEQGVNGGYKITAPIFKLNLYKIVEAMEGAPALTSCACDLNKSCFDGKSCAFKSSAVKLNKQIIKMLQKVKVAI